MSDDDEATPQTCFIIAPITTPPELVERYGGDPDHFEHVMEWLLVPAVERAGLVPIRPKAEGAEVIQAWIVRHLVDADFVLCDMSTVNPNVLFELGIRTAVGKPLCLIRDDQLKAIPFDTGVVNTPAYDSSLAVWTVEEQIAKISEHLLRTLEASDGSNSLWKHFAFSTRATMETEDGSSSDDRLDLLWAELSAIRQQISTIQLNVAASSAASEPLLTYSLPEYRIVNAEAVIPAGVRIAGVPGTVPSADRGMSMTRPEVLQKAKELRQALDEAEAKFNAEYKDGQTSPDDE